MRSSEAIPGNRWPHDMALEIDESPHALLDLLWLREACGLRPTGLDLPPRLVVPPVPLPDAPASRTWEAAWPFVWDEVLEHAGRPRQSELLQELIDLPPSAADRAARIKAFIGPTWRDRFGDEVFDDDGYRRWVAEDAEQRLADYVEYERSPEWVALSAMIPAWEAGLVKVVTIPCVGEFTRVVGRSALLLTAATRDDPEAYRAALARFVDEVPRA
jgi:hypothetical protein